MFIPALRRIMSFAGVSPEKDSRVYTTASATVSSVTLAPYQQYCEIITSNNGAFTVTVPAAAETFGLMYYILHKTKDTDDVTVKVGSTTLATLDTTGDDVLLVSVGSKYIILGGTYT